MHTNDTGVVSCNLNCLHYTTVQCIASSWMYSIKCVDLYVLTVSERGALEAGARAARLGRWLRGESCQSAHWRARTHTSFPILRIVQYLLFCKFNYWRVCVFVFVNEYGCVRLMNSRIYSFDCESVLLEHIIDFGPWQQTYEDVLSKSFVFWLLKEHTSSTIVRIIRVYRKNWYRIIMRNAASAVYVLPLIIVLSFTSLPVQYSCCHVIRTTGSRTRCPLLLCATACSAYVCLADGRAVGRAENSWTQPRGARALVLHVLEQHLLARLPPARVRLLIPFSSHLILICKNTYNNFVNL